MFLWWLGISIYGVYKKAYHCIPAFVAVCTYLFVSFLRESSVFVNTPFFDALSAIELILLPVMLIAMFWCCRKPLQNGKRVYLSMYICGAGIAVKIIRKIYYAVQIERITQSGVNVTQMFKQMADVCNILEQIHAVLFLCLSISTIALINNQAIVNDSLNHK